MSQITLMSNEYIQGYNHRPTISWNLNPGEAFVSLRIWAASGEGSGIHYVNDGAQWHAGDQCCSIGESRARTLTGLGNSGSIALYAPGYAYGYAVLTYTVQKISGAPSNPRLSQTVGDSAALSWDACADPEAGGIYAVTGYEIQGQDSADGVNWGSWTTLGGVPETTCTVYAPPTHGHYRRFRIRAMNNGGEAYYSDWSTTVILQKTPTTACTPPSSVTLPSLAEGTALLTWSGATGGVNNSITGYQIQYTDDNETWTDYDTVTSPGVSVPLNPQRGETRSYRIRTCGSAGASFYSPWTSAVSVQTNRLPAAPQNVTITGLDTYKGIQVWNGGSFTVEWDAASDPDENLSGYIITRRDSSDGITFGTETNLGSTDDSQIVLDNLTSPAGGTYIRISVYAVDGLGALSAPCHVTIRKNAQPTTPGKIEAASPFETSLSLSWGPSADTTDAIQCYEVSYRTRTTGGEYGSWGHPVSTTSPSITLQPTVERGGYIQFRVRAIDVFNAGSSYTLSTEIRRNSQPLAPSNLRINLDTYNGFPVWESGTCYLDWAAAYDEDNNLNGYLVTTQISSDGTHYGVESAGQSVSGTSITMSLPSANRGYYIRIRVYAIDAFGVSSIPASLVIRRNTAPSTPNGLTISPTLFENASIIGQWGESNDDTDRVDHYELSYKTRTRDGAYGDWSTPERLSSTSFAKAPSLARGSFIKFRVCAVDTFGIRSAYSEFAEVQRNIGLGAPANFSASPSLFGNENITLSWDAPSDPNGVFRTYTITIRTRNQSGDPWSSATEIASLDTYDQTSLTIEPPSVSDGGYAQFEISATDIFDITLASSLCEIRKNSPPGVTLITSVSPEIWAGGPITLRWANPVDVDRNVTSYDILYSVKRSGTENVSKWIYGITQVYHSFTPEIEILPGETIEFRVRSCDAKGARSSLSRAVSIRANSPPCSPEAIWPSGSGHTRCEAPVFKVRLDVEPDGQEQTLMARLYRPSIDDYVDEWHSVGSAPPEGGEFLFRYDTGRYNDIQELHLKAIDSLGAASPICRISFTMDLPTWNRAITQGSIICSSGDYADGTLLVLGNAPVTGNCILINDATVNDKRIIIQATSGISHIADLNELARKVNERRQYFGLSGRQYATELGWYKNWYAQVLEMYEYIAEVYTLIGETPRTLTPQATNAPTAATINTVRAMVDGL